MITSGVETTMSFILDNKWYENQQKMLFKILLPYFRRILYPALTLLQISEPDINDYEENWQQNGIILIWQHGCQTRK